MQGQRGTIDSFPEILDFDHGSVPGNSAIDQQIFWNSLRNPSEDRLPEFMLPPSDSHTAHLNSLGHDGLNLGRWSFGEPSSSNSRSGFSSDEPKRDHGWSSSSAEAPPRPTEHYEAGDFLSTDSTDLNFPRIGSTNAPALRRSRSDAIIQNIDINAGSQHQAGDDDCQVIERPDLFKSSKSSTETNPSASSSSDPFGSQSRSGRNLVEEGDVRPDFSLQGRRLSHKRKALEGALGQSSTDGASAFQHAESSAWHPVSARNNAGSSLSITPPSNNVHGFAPSDQSTGRPGIVAPRVSPDSFPSLSVPGNAETFRRNVRMRVNPSHQIDSLPPSNFSLRGTDNGHFGMPSPSPLARLPVNHQPDLVSEQSGGGTCSQNQSFVVRVPPFPRNENSFRRSGASSSRAGNLSAPGSSGVQHEDSSRGNIPSSITEHPMFIPMDELRNSVPNLANWNLAGGNIGSAGNAASPSRTGIRSGNNSSSTSNRVHSRAYSSQYSRRLSELVRRSLLQASVGSESSGQSATQFPPPPGPASSQEMAPSSRAGGEGPPPSYARSALFLDRPIGGVSGSPHSLRNFPIPREGRSRLASEIRGVLDLVRRGEGLRLEDHFMIFDHPAFFGAADVHDRHRDMRLDVDNMSYEELLALEERIGNVNIGLNEETIMKQLKQHKHSCGSMGTMVEIEPCCICQENYINGDDLGMLDCGHEFHTVCIKQWLTHKNLCPICKTTAMKNQ